MKRARELAADALKYSITVITFLLLQQIDPISSLADDLGVQILVALGSALLSVLVIDVLLGRPVLRAQWIVRNQPINSGMPEIDETIEGSFTPISLTYVLEGAGLLYWWAKRLAEKGEVTCVLSIAPSEVVLGSVAVGGGANKFDDDSGNLESKFANGFIKTGSRRCEFELIPVEDASIDQELSCAMHLVREKCGWLIRVIVKCDTGIDGFRIRGR